MALAEEPSTKSVRDVQDPTPPSLATLEREPADNLNPAPAVVPLHPALAADEDPEEKPQELLAVEKTVIQTTARPAVLEPAALEPAVPQRAPEAQEIAPQAPIQGVPGAQTTSVEIALQINPREKAGPAAAHTSESNGVSKPLGLAAEEEPPVFKNVLPQARLVPRPPGIARWIAEPPVPEEWADATRPPAYPASEDVRVPERVLSQCCYDPLRPVAPRGNGLPEPQQEEASSLSPVLPACAQELLGEIGVYPDAPMAAPSAGARTSGMDTTRLQAGALEVRVAAKVPREAGADPEASKAAVNAADFPLPQPSLPQTPLSPLGTIRDASDGLQTNAGSIEKTAQESSSASEPAAGLPEELLAGALATWADDPRDAGTEPSSVPAQFSPAPSSLAMICLGFPLAGGAPALAPAIPCEAVHSLEPRNSSRETAPKKSVFENDACEALPAWPSGPSPSGSRAGLRMPARPDARATQPILPGAEAQPIQPGHRTGTFDAALSCHLPTAYIPAPSSPQIIYSLAERAVTARAVTPYVNFAPPHRGVPGVCAILPARISPRAYYLPELRSLSALSGSLTRRLTLLEYNPVIQRAGGTPGAFTQKSRVRSSPASLFGLPKGSGQIRVPLPPPDKVFKAAVLRTLTGPGSAIVMGTVQAPSRAWTFHWEGTVVAAALPAHPIAEIRSGTRAGLRTKPPATPPQRIETIRAAIDIPLEGPHPPSVRPVGGLQALVPDRHAGSVAPARPHLSRTRVRPAAWIALPPVPAQVLGSASSDRFGPLPEPLPEVHECAEMGLHGEPRWSPISRAVPLQEGASLRNPVLGQSGGAAHPCCAETGKLLILQDNDPSSGWSAPEPLAGEPGPRAGAPCLEISETIQLGITMKKSRY